MPRVSRSPQTYVLGPERCALAGRGDVAVRVDELVDRLRSGPIPAPTADPPGALTYVVFLVLNTPEPGTVCPSDREPFDPDFDKPLP